MKRRKDQLTDRDQSDAHVQCNGVRAIESGDSQIGRKERHFEAEDCETVLWTFILSVHIQGESCGTAVETYRQYTVPRSSA
jgi:hypothetical protein